MTTLCKAIAHRSPRRPRGLGARYRARDPLSVLGRRALDQRRQSAGRRGPRSLDQRDRSRILAGAGHAARRIENQWSESTARRPYGDDAKGGKRTFLHLISAPRNPLISFVSIFGAKILQTVRKLSDTFARGPNFCGL
jgi:hypothetical protein